MIRRMAIILLAGLLTIAVGCSNSADKGKNKDKDVPKAGKADPN